MSAPRDDARTCAASFSFRCASYARSAARFPFVVDRMKAGPSPVASAAWSWPGASANGSATNRKPMGSSPGSMASGASPTFVEPATVTWSDVSPMGSRGTTALISRGPADTTSAGTPPTVTRFASGRGSKP